VSIIYIFIKKLNKQINPDYRAERINSTVWKGAEAPQILITVKGKE